MSSKKPTRKLFRAQHLVIRCGTVLATHLVVLILAYIQSIYFLILGLWPIFHMRSFEKISGPKTDHWLVVSVGALISVIGGVLLVAIILDQIVTSILILAFLSAAVLAWIDIYYALSKQISKVYLLDAVIEIAMCVSWLVFSNQA